MNGVFDTDFEYLYISIYLGKLFVERAVLCCAVLCSATCEETSLLGLIYVM